jgi:hypothetical protein
MPLPSPSLTVINEWPAVMGTADAAAYLGESTSQFTRLVRLYPNKLRTFNLLPNGEVKFRREDIDAYIEWRQSVGVERRAG